MTKTKNKFEVKEIEFDAIAYAEAKNQYQEYLKLRELALNEIHFLLKQSEIDFEEEEMLSIGIPAFYDLVKKLYQSQLTLELSGKKLCDLLEINTSNLSNLFDQLRNCKHKLPPEEYEFTVFTDSEEQNKKLEMCQKLADYLNELSKEINLKSAHLQTGFSMAIRYDHHLQKYVPNLYFIKY